MGLSKCVFAKSVSEARRWSFEAGRRRLSLGAGRFSRNLVALIQVLVRSHTTSVWVDVLQDGGRIEETLASKDPHTLNWRTTTYLNPTVQVLLEVIQVLHAQAAFVQLGHRIADS